MPKEDSKKPVVGPKALEMILRDVLSGLEDIAIVQGFEFDGLDMNVIGVAPVHHGPRRRAESEDGGRAASSANPDPSVVYLHAYRRRNAL
ncbi:MAG: hypothetical protein GWO16_08180 [Gammaproteobacteria bacterium]|nr:hypothetical protein [Gammaproteobacteria bacterium]NIR97920.1 hypothetical protein [Gammaproteobacteria bacterium]NIT63625.1 hypothetical protein [Gammaproteobacteria bacterium]NIV20561.1 hypothetical protein [Gammaproteobacteria bacterium]NIY32205.1 hypothetical protein [Gammaproteobacteria bacterium]